MMRRLIPGFAMQPATTRGAVHEYSGISLFALRAVEEQFLATALATFAIDRVQMLALGAQSPLPHRARGGYVPLRRN